MLVGAFGQDGRPYLEGLIRFPRLDVQLKMWFLVDTGCDVTTLMPQASRAMRLPLHLLENPRSVVGAGGATECYPEPAMLAFYEAGRCIWGYEILVDVMPPSRQTAWLPSLLGRDILDRWSMTYTPLRKQLTFEVLEYDLATPVPM